VLRGPRPGAGASAGRSLAIERGPTGPASWAQPEATRCGERLLARRGIRIGAAEPETQRVLCTAAGTGLVPAAGLAHRSGHGHRVVPNPASGGGPKGDFRSGDAADPNGTAPAQRGWAVPRATRAGDQSAAAALSPLHASAPWRPQSAALRLLGAGWKYVRTQALNPGGRVWGPWPWPEAAGVAEKHT